MNKKNAGSLNFKDQNSIIQTKKFNLQKKMKECVSYDHFAYF